MKWMGCEIGDRERAEIIERMCRYREITTDGCWNWTGFINPDGYGQTSFKHRNVLAHRLTYIAFHNIDSPPKSSGLQFDHLCRNRRCFNPAHVELVTARTNTLRSYIAPATLNHLKTTCIRGHELIGDNIQFKSGHRICRACRRIYNKETYDRLYSHGRRKKVNHE
jgi:hypothetical protein